MLCQTAESLFFKEQTAAWAARLLLLQKNFQNRHKPRLRQRCRVCSLSCLEDVIAWLLFVARSFSSPSGQSWLFVLVACYCTFFCIFVLSFIRAWLSFVLVGCYCTFVFITFWTVMLF